MGALAGTIGVFAIVCAWCDFDWFMENYRARLFVSLLGRDGARRFYIFLGCVLVAFGLLIT